jgi:tRNA(Arg) A34 adenosine deaminase TadA
LIDGGPRTRVAFMADVEASWGSLPLGARTALTQQWAGVATRALPCGAAIIDRSDALLAAGRNRAYDPVTGADPLEGTSLAHAELNAVARVATGSDLSEAVLWSTQRPCAMCSAAIAFVGIGTVRYLAEDPSSAVQSDLDFESLTIPLWSAVSTVLFLSTGALLRGAGDGNLARHRTRDPAVADLVLELVAGDGLGRAARGGTSLPAAVAAFAHRVT